MGTRSKNFASGPLRVVVSGTTLILSLIPNPVNPDYGRNSTLYLMLIQSTYIQPSRGPCPSSAACCHMAGTVTVSSKAHFSVLSNQLLWDSEQNDMTSDFHEQVPTVTLLSQE